MMKIGSTITIRKPLRFRSSSGLYLDFERLSQRMFSAAAETISEKIESETSENLFVAYEARRRAELVSRGQRHTTILGAEEGESIRKAITAYEELRPTLQGQPVIPNDPPARLHWDVQEAPRFFINFNPRNKSSNYPHTSHPKTG